MRRHQTATVVRLASREDLLADEAKRRAHYHTAFASSEGLKTFADAIPPDDQLEQPVERTIGNDTYWSQLRRQPLTVLAFKTGVSVAADLYLGRFDTHARTDAGQNWLLANLTDGLDYLWDYAERHGMADGLFVVVGDSADELLQRGQRQGPLAHRGAM